MITIPVKKRPSILTETPAVLQEIGSKLNLLHFAMKNDNSTTISEDIEQGVSRVLTDIDLMLNDISEYIESANVIAEPLLEAAEETMSVGMLVTSFLEADQDGEIKKRFVKEMLRNYGCVLAGITPQEAGQAQCQAEFQGGVS